MKPKNKNFCLFRCFEPISKQLKQTELFRNKPKQTETTLNFLKIPIYDLYQTVSVGLLFVSVQSKHRNSLFRYRTETTETKVLFRIVPKLVSVPVSVVSKDTLVAILRQGGDTLSWLPSTTDIARCTIRFGRSGVYFLSRELLIRILVLDFMTCSSLTSST